MGEIRFETEPARYRHCQLHVDGSSARLELHVQEDAGQSPGYRLKLNSYDLSVDIELADAIQRVRFEHPEVKVLVVTSARDGIFCSGANIYMLQASSHSFKVNFCKFTNETRLYLEDLAENSGIRSIAAVNGTASGGGYELALACSHILLQDDGNSAVSLPEVPKLGVLPGTGGLTRLVDKRNVRRDLADAFCTIAEGVRGKRAFDWHLVDAFATKSRFRATLEETVQGFAAQATQREGPGVTLSALSPQRAADSTEYRHVSVHIDRPRRVATLALRGPDGAIPSTLEALRQSGSGVWALALFRELDDALLDLRFNHPEIGLLVLKSEGDPERVLASDRALFALCEKDWFAREIVLHARRVLKRLELSARSIFAVIDRGSCFAGSLLELAFAADRSYMAELGDSGPTLGLSPLNFGPLAASNGLCRLELRVGPGVSSFSELEARGTLIDTALALRAGLVTFAPDQLDWDDELRLAIEERVAFSPDALTAMEASLRFAGPETLETKIFGRLSAWQNWVFGRPNATGAKGALTLYGSPERPAFDFERT